MYIAVILENYSQATEDVTVIRGQGQGVSLKVGVGVKVGGPGLGVK